MSKLFGANWLTTLWGFIALAAGAIALHPESVAFLPDTIEGWVKGFAGLITLIAGAAFAVQVKSKNVTGGNVQQTVDGSVAAPGTQDLVDKTVIASIKSGATVTPEQQQAVQHLI